MFSVAGVHVCALCDVGASHKMARRPLCFADGDTTMVDALGIDWNLVIVITAPWSIWIYPAVFVHLYAARKLDEAERLEARKKNATVENV